MGNKKTSKYPFKTIPREREKTHMKCYKCKKEIPPESKFCPKCGSPQQFTKELIDRAINSDQIAITQLYNMTKDNVYYTIKTMISDEDTAQDLTQDTFLKAMKNLGQLNEPMAFRGWIKKIARNMTIDILRKRKVISFSQMVSADSDEAVEFEDDRPENLPEVVIDRKETTRLIGEILDTLSAEQRVVAEMFYYDGLSIKEISQELGVNENTIKSRLKYARNKIEAGVLELEKNGTKLYSLAPIPFLLLLFRSQDTYAAELPDADILQAIQSGNVSISVEDSFSGQSTDSGNTSKETPEIAAEVAKTGTGTAAKGGITKIIVGIVATALIGGMIAGIMAHNKEDKLQEPVEAVAEPVEVTEPVEVIEPEEPTIEPELPPAEKAKAEYKGILDEYIEACRISDDEYLADTENYMSQYTNVSIEIIPYHQSEELSFYYAYCDINKDNIDEMVIGSGNDAEINPVAVYTYDAEQEKANLIVDGSQFYRTTLSIMDDGTILERGSGGALAGGYDFYKIAEDGYSLDKIFGYEYEYENWEDTQGHYYNESGDLSKEECEQRLNNLTEIVYSWIPLMENSNAEQEELQQATETLVLKNYDGYSYYEDGHIKYRLDTADEKLSLTMWSLTSPDVYQERHFTMDLSTAEISGNEYKIHNITELLSEENLSFDRSENFYGIQFTFSDDTVTMEVEANEQNYAGGSDDNILTGIYVFNK